MIGRRIRRIILSAAVLATSAPLLAVQLTPQNSGEEARIARCIHRSARGLAWLEVSLWGLRDQEGGWIGAEISNRDGSRDLGPFQVNSQWVPRIALGIGRDEADVRIWLRDDPCFNTDAARWIFLAALSKTRDFWRAVGVYHSPTIWRQRMYAVAVAGHIGHRFGAAAFGLRQRHYRELRAIGLTNEDCAATAFRTPCLGGEVPTRQKR